MSLWDEIEPYVQYWLNTELNPSWEYDHRGTTLRRRQRQKNNGHHPLENSHELQQRPDTHSDGLNGGAEGAMDETEFSPSSHQDNRSADGAHEPRERMQPSTGVRTRENIAYRSKVENQEEIEELKTRYIVGRIVGRDLLANDGRMIARKGDRITRDIVAESETAGKLVELIINMMIEEFDR